MAWQALFGERATTKLVGIFDSEDQAATLMEHLEQQAGLTSGQLRLVGPHEKNYDIKMEPETQGIARTAIRAHIILGAAGCVTGMALWGILYASGWQAIRASPGLAALAILFLTTVSGMMLGGLVTARPDHELVILRVRKAVEQHKWSLIVHPYNAAQCDQAETLLKGSAADLWRSV